MPPRSRRMAAATASENTTSAGEKVRSDTAVSSGAKLTIDLTAVQRRALTTFLAEEADHLDTSKVQIGKAVPEMIMLVMTDPAARAAWRERMRGA